MDFSLPQAYLIGLLVILGAAAVLVARQILRVRSDEVALIRLENASKGDEQSAADLYELASVQLRKRLYGQAVDNLKLASKCSAGEPAEAQALIENALGFALAAQSNYSAAIKHYRAGHCSDREPGATIKQRSSSPRINNSLIRRPAMIVLPAPGSSASRYRIGCLGSMCS